VGYLLRLVLFFLIINIQVNHSKSCLMMSGNAEKITTLWGAAARITEIEGLPDGFAGSSSAAITAFLLDSLHENTTLKNLANKCNNQRCKNNLYAFTIKSFVGYWDYILKHSSYKNVQSLLSNDHVFDKVSAIAKEFGGPIKFPKIIYSLIKTLPNNQSRKILFLLNSKYRKWLLNPEFTNYFSGADLSKEKNNDLILKQRNEELSEMIKNLGRFDIINDEFVFFRPGFANFEGLARMSGRMANFFAGYNMRKSHKQMFETFVKTCSKNSEDLPWQTISKKAFDNTRTCGEYLTTILGYYLNVHNKIEPLFVKNLASPNKKFTYTFPKKYKSNRQEKIKVRFRLLDQLGSGQSNEQRIYLGNTSLISGQSVALYNSLTSKYLTATLNPDEFKIQNINDYKIGYFSRPDTMNLIKQNLANNSIWQMDYRKNIFTDMNELIPQQSMNWHSVLKYSPAEPTLSKLLPIGKNHLNLGGWADNNMNPQLKAAGCSKIYKVSNQRYYMFPAKTFKRLFNFDYPTKKQVSSQEFSAIGASNSLNKNFSLWDEMFNLANKYSSVNLSLPLNFLAICISWQDLNSSEGFHEHFKRGYFSPVYLSKLYIDSESEQQIFNWQKQTNNQIIPEEKSNSWHFDNFTKQWTRSYAGCTPTKTLLKN